MGEQVVVVEGLTKRYGPVEGVRDLDFEVRPGEVLGFLGPNGAGKSTTIRCLLGLLRPSAGRIRAFGMDVTDHGVDIRRRIAYVPGELRLPERMTGHELVRAVGAMRGGFDASRRDELADRLRAELRRPLRDLSTGNRRKIALLLAFAAHADLLVLDEPTSGLDPLMQHEFLGLVREAVAGGATVLLSSHVLSEIQRASDRVIVLGSGRIVATGTVDELRSRARQRIEIWFEQQPPVQALAAVPGLEDCAVDGNRFSATLAGPIQPLLQMLAGQQVASMLVEEPDLEEAFLGLYGEAA
ncbi:MAG TPA: ABC transporter ATP-binding protein [Candidatus Limnocylindria bacterium]|jgi:ABC-2 type transport system ATP-binding protein